MSYYEWEAEQKGYYRFYRRKSFETPAHFHGSIEFIFVESGEQRVTIDGETRVLKDGDACFCDSFSVHFFAPNNNADTFILLGEREYFDSVFNLFNDKTPPRFFRFENFELFHFLLDNYSKKSTNTGGRYAAFDGCVKILLSEIAENNTLLPRKTDKKSTLVCDILQYAEQNPNADLSLMTVAKNFGYSHEYLSRILHKYLAENWNTYVNRLRVRKADILLKTQKERSVLEIAYECGFDSPNTFYRAYKKEFERQPRRT